MRIFMPFVVQLPLLPYINRCTGIVRLAPPLIVSACAATFTIFSVKSISLLVHEMLLNKTPAELQHPLFWIMAAVLGTSGTLQIMWMNRALIIFPATSVVPTYYVLFTIVRALTPPITDNFFVVVFIFFGVLIVVVVFFLLRRCSPVPF